MTPDYLNHADPLVQRNYLLPTSMAEEVRALAFALHVKQTIIVRRGIELAIAEIAANRTPGGHNWPPCPRT